MITTILSVQARCLHRQTPRAKIINRKPVITITVFDTFKNSTGTTSVKISVTRVKNGKGRSKIAERIFKIPVKKIKIAMILGQIERRYTLEENLSSIKVKVGIGRFS